jgi:formylglycine-generating enzyme required for sulfatase activity
MGSESGNEDEHPVHEVTIDPFYIGKFPITVAEFKAFLEVTSYDFPQNLLSEFPNHPVTNVNWYDAIKYCNWLGEDFRLPTEAEWEYAATAGYSNNVYPWGNRNWNELPELHQLFKNGPENVGIFEPNGFGIFDMGMNVHEWCADWYAADYYSRSPSHNPRGPENGKRRASRGGSWRHQIKITRCAARSSIPPEFRYADYGFRIVREIE